MLAAVTDEAAERFGDTPAFVAEEGWAVTYRELAALSHEVAAGLRRRGVGEGDVVALVLPPTPEYVVAYLAAARIGAVTAGVNARLAPAERDAVLDRLGGRLVLATAELAPTRAGEAEVLEVPPATEPAGVLPGLREPGATVERLPDDPDRAVAVVFTSGTTGPPKGAVFAERQLDFITRVDTGRRWGGGGPALAATSLAHLGPMTKLPGNLHRGGTTYLVHRWRAADALDLLERHRMTTVAGIPTQIALLLRRPDLDERDLSSVRAVVMGGAPATPALVREARRRLGAPVAVRYSCTEAGIGVGTAFDDPPEDAEETVGRPHHGVELTVLAGDGTPLPPGEVGEICLRSPAVMAGYWHDPEATRAAFTPDGAVRTGDLGFVDGQGRLHLTGRRSERWIRGGYNVHPAPVEAALADHPGVAEVAVVPRSDEIMGEIGVAVVVAADPGDPPTLDDLRHHAEARLAGYELPEALVVVPGLPLTAGDKVDRAALAEQVTDRQATE